MCKDCPYRQDLITELVAATAVQSEQIERIEQGVEAINTSLAGNGREGLIVRLDRVEQRHKSLKTFFWVFVTAIVGATIKFLFNAYS